MKIKNCLKPKVLFILHFPPPVHGAAMVGQFIQKSKVINESFDATYINLSTSTKVDEVGKGGINKIASTFKLVVRVIKALQKANYDLCYMTLTAKDYGFYKDFIIVALLKIFGKKIIYHFHNKGVSTRQHKTLDNLLYKITFNATKSILLSSLLYRDISKYVARENVFVCGNGIPEIGNKLLIEKRSNVNERCKLLFLSNMVVEKGVLVLLEAINYCEEITGNKLSYSYSENNRIGDHIWYISDVSKFKSHYPDWDYTYDIEETLKEMFTSFTKRSAVTA